MRLRISAAARTLRAAVHFRQNFVSRLFLVAGLWYSAIGAPAENSTGLVLKPGPIFVGLEFQSVQSSPTARAFFGSV